MATEKSAVYKVHNGTDFDTINFKTIASQVKMSSGIDLESGFANSNYSNGYQKLPSGIIIQWLYSDFAIDGVTRRTFPIIFPNNCWICVATAKDNNPRYASVKVLDSGGVTLNPMAYGYYYILAIGY